MVGALVSGIIGVVGTLAVRHMASEPLSDNRCAFTITYKRNPPPNLVPLLGIQMVLFWYSNGENERDIHMEHMYSFDSLSSDHARESFTEPAFLRYVDFFKDKACVVYIAITFRKRVWSDKHPDGGLAIITFKDMKAAWNLEDPGTRIPEMYADDTKCVIFGSDNFSSLSVNSAIFKCSNVIPSEITGNVKFHYS